jgi:hypothetical protein
MKNENDVKKAVKKLLDKHGWFHWPNSAGPYSVSGIPDRMAVRDGQFIAIECKFGGNTVTNAQASFLAEVQRQRCLWMVVDENNIDALDELLK